MYYPNVTIEQLQQKVLPKICKDGDHWLWAGAKSSAGYPYWSEGLRKRNWRVHRLMYALTRGIGMEDSDKDNVIDHICNIKLCVNPKHLQMISQKENVRRNPKHDGAHIDYHLSTHHIQPGEVIEYVKKKPYGHIYRRCLYCQRLKRNNPVSWKAQRELDKKAVITGK